MPTHIKNSVINDKNHILFLHAAVQWYLTGIESKLNVNL